MVYFTGSDVVLFVIGFFLPPLAVLFKEGCGCEFLISIGLTLLGHVPGIAYAWWVIYSNREDPRTHQRISSGPYRPLLHQTDPQRRSYVTVASQPPPHGAPPGPGVIHHYQGQPHLGQLHQGQPGQPGQLQHQNSSHSSTQHHYTTSTSSSGPVRTTHTTHTTQYVVPAPVDKKDQNPPPY